MPETCKYLYRFKNFAYCLNSRPWAKPSMADDRFGAYQLSDPIQFLLIWKRRTCIVPDDLDEQAKCSGYSYSAEASST